MVLLGENLLESNGLKITTCVTQQDFFFPIREYRRFEQPSLLHIQRTQYHFLVSVPKSPALLSISSARVLLTSFSRELSDPGLQTFPQMPVFLFVQL